MRRLSWALLWTGVLLAGPALALDTACDEDCKKKAAEALPACVDRCPRAGDVESDRRFQKCTEKCSNTFKVQVAACKKQHCGAKSAEPASRGKKKHKSR